MIDYRIYTEYYCKMGRNRKQLRSGHRIRVDCFGGFPLWKVSELLRVKNWKIVSGHDDTISKTYYIDVLE